MDSASRDDLGFATRGRGRLIDRIDRSFDRAGRRAARTAVASRARRRGDARLRLIRGRRRGGDGHGFRFGHRRDLRARNE